MSEARTKPFVDFRDILAGKVRDSLTFDDFLDEAGNPVKVYRFPWTFAEFWIAEEYGRKAAASLSDGPLAIDDVSRVIVSMVKDQNGNPYFHQISGIQELKKAPPAAVMKLLKFALSQPEGAEVDLRVTEGN